AVGRRQQAVGRHWQMRRGKSGQRDRELFGLRERVQFRHDRRATAGAALQNLEPRPERIVRILQWIDQSGEILSVFPETIAEKTDGVFIEMKLPGEPLSNSLDHRSLRRQIEAEVIEPAVHTAQRQPPTLI